ncbi:MAG: RloB domain-containing protein [Spirochaetia bacterium]|jgi:hypothetical protein|nr:RloB domain-containing protein [Spirochaetia bacterium]
MARKRITTAPKKTMLIVTASEEESLFFSQMRKDCRYTNLTVQWAEGVKDELEALILYTARKRSHGKFNEAWLLFGFEELGITAVDVKAITSFAEKKKVKLAWCNPGIQLWYMLHIMAPKGYVDTAAAIDDALPRYIPGYFPGKDFLLGADGLNLHLALYPNKAKAAINARSYNQMAEAKTSLPATNLVYMLNAITDNCGLADITHNQKMIGMKR